MPDPNTIKRLPGVTLASLSASDALEIEQGSSGSLTLGILLGYIAATLEVTPTGGTKASIATLLQALDPSAPGFQAAMTTLFQAWANALPVYSGSGPAPVPTGQAFMNNGTVQIAQ